TPAQALNASASTPQVPNRSPLPQSDDPHSRRASSPLSPKGTTATMSPTPSSTAAGAEAAFTARAAGLSLGWSRWVDLDPAYVYDPSKPLTDQVVPTAEIICSSLLFELLFSRPANHVLLAGPPGCGKSQYVSFFFDRRMFRHMP